jgi:acyl dehydratase
VRQFANLEELRGAAGAELGPSGWLTIAPERLNAFDEVTGGNAREYLAIALIPVFIGELMVVQGVSLSLNYGSNRSRFVARPRAGDRLRAHARILSARDVAGGVEVVTEWTITVERSAQPACITETVSRYYA